MDIIFNNLNKIIFALAAVSTVIAVAVNFARIKKFLTEVKVELSKVSWSSRKQLSGATGVVVALTFILTVYIGIVDLGLSRLLTFLIQ